MMPNDDPTFEQWPLERFQRLGQSDIAAFAGDSLDGLPKPERADIEAFVGLLAAIRGFVSGGSVEDGSSTQQAILRMTPRLLRLGEKQTLVGEVLARRQVPVAWILQHLDGIAQDQVKASYRDRTQIQQLAWALVGVPARMGLRVIVGGEHPEGDRLLLAASAHAFMIERLGRLGRDLDRGKIYIPQHVMDEYGVHKAELTGRRITAPLRRLIVTETELADAAISRFSEWIANAGSPDATSCRAVEALCQRWIAKGRTLAERPEIAFADRTGGTPEPTSLVGRLMRKLGINKSRG